MLSAQEEKQIVSKLNLNSHHDKRYQGSHKSKEAVSVIQRQFSLLNTEWHDCLVDSRNKLQMDFVNTERQNERAVVVFEGAEDNHEGFERHEEFHLGFVGQFEVTKAKSVFEQVLNYKRENHE